jgi:hypothetical protein
MQGIQALTESFCRFANLAHIEIGRISKILACEIFIVGDFAGFARKWQVALSLLEAI